MFFFVLGLLSVGSGSTKLLQAPYSAKVVKTSRGRKLMGFRPINNPMQNQVHRIRNSPQMNLPMKNNQVLVQPQARLPVSPFHKNNIRVKNPVNVQGNNALYIKKPGSPLSNYIQEHQKFKNQGNLVQVNGGQVLVDQNVEEEEGEPEVEEDSIPKEWIYIGVFASVFSVMLIIIIVLACKLSKKNRRRR